MLEIHLGYPTNFGMVYRSVCVDFTVELRGGQNLEFYPK